MVRGAKDSQPMPMFEAKTEDLLHIAGADQIDEEVFKNIDVAGNNELSRHEYRDRRNATQGLPIQFYPQHY